MYWKRTNRKQAMKTYNVYTVKTVSRFGNESVLTMYSLSADVEKFYAALSSNQNVVEMKVAFRKPSKVLHFNDYIGCA